MGKCRVRARSFKSHVRADEGSGMIAAVMVELFGFLQEKMTLEQGIEVKTWRMREVLG
jgi:hypothetical protein